MDGASRPQVSVALHSLEMAVVRHVMSRAQPCFMCGVDLRVSLGVLSHPHLSLLLLESCL
eukprot:3357102-Amphidinium_carterae.1